MLIGYFTYAFPGQIYISTKQYVLSQEILHRIMYDYGR